MNEIIHARSTLLSLITNGRFRHILTPWHIEVDTQKEFIKIRKRNWFLIGFDTKVYAFRFVRTIDVNTHLFGADIKLRITGGNAEALSISKFKAARINELLVDYNNGKKGRHIIFH
jgi:hypothetical protein